MRKKISLVGSGNIGGTLAHLIALKEISESIEKHNHELRKEISPQLEHFLNNRSYNKALKFLEKIQPN